MICFSVSATTANATVANAVAKHRALSATSGEEIQVDLVLCFFSQHARKEAPFLAKMLQQSFPQALVVTVLQASAEPRVSLLAAHLPSVLVHPVRILPNGLITLPARPHSGSLFLFADPRSVNGDALARALQLQAPKIGLFGGLVSGVTPDDGCTFSVGEHVLHEGAVGFHLEGNARVESIESEGCKPLGGPMIVTKQVQNGIVELDGRPVQPVLRALLKKPAHDLAPLTLEHLFLRVETNPQSVRYLPSETLIRPIQFDPKGDRLQVAHPLAPFCVVQFLVLDAAFAKEQFEAKLDGLTPDQPGTAMRVVHQPSAIFVFSDVQRAAFDDAGIVRNEFADVAVVQGNLAGTFGQWQGAHTWQSSLVVAHAMLPLAPGQNHRTATFD